MEKISRYIFIVTVFVLLFCCVSCYVGAESIEDAVTAANRRLSYSNYSKYGLIDALVTFDGFSRETAENAVNSLNVNWTANAIPEAKTKLSYTAYSKAGLIEALVSFDKFDREEAEYAVNSLNIDWNEQAIGAAKNRLKYSSYSKSGLIEALISFDKFNREEAEYAVNKVYSSSTEQAVSAAENRVKYSPYSKEGLIDALVKFDKFSRDESETAVNTLDIDWRQQAVKKAESTLQYQTLSDSGLLQRLISDGFTQEEAEYAVSYITSAAQNTEINRNSEEYRAVEKAKSYIRYNYSRQTIIDKLIKDGFSETTAIYAADNCEADWNLVAVSKAQSYLKYDYSKNKIYAKLLSDQFTESQTQYAVDNCGADWNLVAVNKAQSYLKYDYSFTKLYSKLLNDEFTDAQAQYGVENCGADWNIVAYNKALSYVKYNYSNEKIYSKLLSDGFDDEQAALAVQCLEDFSCDASVLMAIAENPKAVYDGNISETTGTDDSHNENGNSVSEIQAEFSDEITSEAEDIVNSFETEHADITTLEPNSAKDTYLTDLWEINMTDNGIRISSTDANMFGVHLIEINNGESVQSDRNLVINISVSEQETMIFLLILDEENNTYNVFPMNKTDINCFVSSDPAAQIPSTSNTNDWNSAAALGGTVILGNENNAEFIKGLQTGYLNIVLFYIDRESDTGVMCNSELTGFDGFEDAVLTARNLTK